MATRETFAAGRIESPARHAERALLVQQVYMCRIMWATKPHDHSAECAYQKALEDLIRFEERRS